jgi:hypothetical protein
MKIKFILIFFSLFFFYNGSSQIVKKIENHKPVPEINEGAISDNSYSTLFDIDNDGIKDYVFKYGKFIVYWKKNISDNSYQLDTIAYSYHIYNYHFALLDQDSAIDMLFIIDDGRPKYLLNTLNQGVSKSKYLNNETESKEYYCTEIKAIDIDFDGDLDPISIGYYTQRSRNYYTTIYWLNTGGGAKMDGPFEFTNSNVSNTAFHHLEIKDINNDGYDDVLSALPYGFNLYLSDSSTKSYEHKILNDLAFTNNMEKYMSILNIIDINEDGFNDLFVKSTFDNKIKFYLDNGSQNFDSLLVIENLDVKAIDDLDNDGLPDLILLEPNKLIVLQNLGNNKYSEPIEITFYNYLGSGLRIADFNEDGKLDIATSKGILFNKGNFKFEIVPIAYQYHVTANPFYLVDYDKDSDIDFVYYPGVWWENLGNFMFIYHIDSTNNFYRNEDFLGFIDYNNDGNQDLLINDFRYLSIMEWINDTTYIKRMTNIPYLAYGSELLKQDMDFDGDIDIIKVITGRKINWYENTLTSDFISRTIYNISNGSGYHSKLEFLDFDKDQDLDLFRIYTDNGQSTLEVMTNENKNFPLKKIALEYIPDAFSVDTIVGDRFIVVTSEDFSSLFNVYDYELNIKSSQQLYSAYSGLTLKNKGNSLMFNRRLNSILFYKNDSILEHQGCCYYSNKPNVSFYNESNSISLYKNQHVQIITEELDVIDVNFCDLTVEIDVLNKNICNGEPVIFNALSNYDNINYYLNNESWSQPQRIFPEQAFWPTTTSNYTLLATDIYGCQATDTFAIAVKQFNDSVLIKLDDNKIIASSGHINYKWYDCLSNSPINIESTNCVFQPTYPGIYKAEITNNEGCITLTNCIDITTISDTEITNQIYTFPNPTTDKIRIVFDKEISSVKVLLCKVDGSIMDVFLLSKQASFIDVSNLAKGIYFLKINNDKEETIVKRFIKE